MAETLQIEIKDTSGASDMRPNKDLEDFFNGTAPKAGANTGGKQPPPLPPKAGATPPPLPEGNGSKPDYSVFKNPMAQLEKIFPELAAVAAGSYVVAKTFSNLTENIEAASDAMATFADNERAGLVQGGKAGLNALRSPMEEIPILGSVFRSQNAMIDAIVRVPEKLVAAFSKQAEKIAPYSGQISTAMARSDVRQIVADIREANTMGDDYAKLIDAESRIDNTIREFLSPIKKAVVEEIASKLALLADILEIGKKIWDVASILVVDLPNMVVRAATPIIGPFMAIDDLKKIGEKILKIMEGDDTPKDLFESFFKSAGQAKFSGSFSG